MIFSLFPTVGGSAGALISLVSYGVSITVPILLLSSQDGEKFKDCHRLPKLPVLSAVLMICVIYIGNLFSSLLSEAFAAFGYGISASFPVYNDAPSILISFVHLVILPPILEEILFRRCILNTLLPYGKSCAVIFSSLLFALFHMNLMQIPFALLCGVFFGYFTVKTGSLTFAVLMHFLNNLSAFAITYIKADITLAGFSLAGVLIIPLGAFCAVILYKNGFFREKPSFFKVSFTVIAYAIICLLFSILAIQPIGK